MPARLDLSNDSPSWTWFSVMLTTSSLVIPRLALAAAIARSRFCCSSTELPTTRRSGDHAGPDRGTRAGVPGRAADQRAYPGTGRAADHGARAVLVAQPERNNGHNTTHPREKRTK